LIFDIEIVLRVKHINPEEIIAKIFNPGSLILNKAEVDIGIYAA